MQVLEMQALARVREQNINVHLMIPFVCTRWELEQCLTLVDAIPLGRQHGLHRWVMAVVPSVVHWLPEYVGIGIDGVSIGSNDLTQLMLGVDLGVSHPACGHCGAACGRGGRTAAAAGILTGTAEYVY